MYSKRKYCNYIKACVVVSTVSIITTAVTFTSKKWIYGSATVVKDINEVEDSTINYGLWGGTLIRKITQSPRTYDLFSNDNNNNKFVINVY